VTSLRPLATIALLAAIGGFLYMKINESEPQLPAGVDEWSTGDLQIGGDVETLALGETATTSTASTTATTSATGSSAAATPSGGAAPPYVAPPKAATTSSTSPPSGGAAPTWTPGPPAAQPSAASESSPIARTADPAVPAIPPLPSTAAPAGQSTLPSSAPELDMSADLTMPPPPATGGTSAPTNNSAATSPAPVTPALDPPTPKPSMYAAARVAAQGALDRGELAKALAILSDWYGDPSLTASEAADVKELLSQLAGSVIYEGPPAHRLLPKHVVQNGETLLSIAAKYSVPWQLLAKVNGIADPNTVSAGQVLKVVPGPFSAVVDVSKRQMTLMLDNMYAGVFPLDLDPSVTVEEGEWKVEQKQLTPAIGGMYAPSGAATEDRALLLVNQTTPTSATAIVRGPGNPDPVSAAPRDRILRLSAADVADVFDILSEGSKVTIKR
jgi:LysM repeat protein